jgi:hypothetical protein
MSERKIGFKRDKYKQSRGGYSRCLLLTCQHCDFELMTYQKDGPGILKRLYCDRILSSKLKLEDENLVCTNCHTLLGVYTIYKKEQRPAYRLFVASIKKKIIKF